MERKIKLISTISVSNEYALVASHSMCDTRSNLSPHQVVVLPINSNYFSIWPTLSLYHICRCLSLYRRCRDWQKTGDTFFEIRRTKAFGRQNINDENRCFVKKMSFFEPFDVCICVNSHNFWRMAHLSSRRQFKIIIIGSVQVILITITLFSRSSCFDTVYLIHRESARERKRTKTDDDNHFIPKMLTIFWLMMSIWCAPAEVKSIECCQFLYWSNIK